MQETAPAPSRPRTLSFGQFFSALIHSLNEAGIRFCALRNYEGFSEGKVGRDVDLLIHRSQLQGAVRALSAIEGVRIVGYAERYYVATVLLGGIAVTPNIRALQVDFYVSLTWKGLSYLPAESVFQSTVQHGDGNPAFPVPSPVHEAIVSLFAGLLLAGVLKERYFERAQRTFGRDRSGAVAALLPHFGGKAATRVVDSVIEGDRRKVIACVRPLRAELVLRGLQNPFRNARNIARHFAREFVARFTPQDLEIVCIAGPRGCGKAAIIEGLMPILQATSVVVAEREFGPRLPAVLPTPGLTLGEDADEETGGNLRASTGSVLLWLLEEWMSRFIGKPLPTLRICGSSYYDLLADPESYSPGVPKWLLRLVGKLLPSADLWILLEPPAGGKPSIGLNTSQSQPNRPIAAYRSFVKARKRQVILDASKPPAVVTELAYAAIIDTLAERADKRLKSRFK